MMLSDKRTRMMLVLHSQRQNQQNQQNTIASTIATGAENTDAADED